MTWDEATYYMSLVNLMLGFFNLAMFYKTAYIVLTARRLYVRLISLAAVMFLNLTIGLWMIRTSIGELT